MLVLIGDNEQQINARIITIVVNDIEYSIRLNNQNEIEISKCNFGEGGSSMNIKPYAHNDIKIF